MSHFVLSGLFTLSEVIWSSVHRLDVNVPADLVQVLPVVQVLGIVGHVIPQLKQTV